MLVDIDDLNRYTYNGEDYDFNTGLQYLRARYYSTGTGNFISQDTYLGDLLNPLSQNRYTYAHNSPVMFDDPSGHCSGVVGDSDLCTDPNCPYCIIPYLSEQEVERRINAYISEIIVDAIVSCEYAVDCDALYETLNQYSLEQLPYVTIHPVATMDYGDRLTNAFSDYADIFVLGGISTQLDGPLPFADAFILFAGLCLSAYLVIDAMATTEIQWIEVFVPTVEFPATEIITSDEIGTIAGEYGNFQCVEAADAIQSELERRGEHGEIVIIQYPSKPGYIISNLRGGKVISENGIHYGVLYGDNVCCNVHPFGLEYSAWLADFEAIGERSVVNIPF